MSETVKRAQEKLISDLGIRNAKIHWNLTPEELQEHALEKVEGALS